MSFTITDMRKARREGKGKPEDVKYGPDIFHHGVMFRSIAWATCGVWVGGTKVGILTRSVPRTNTTSPRQGWPVWRMFSEGFIEVGDGFDCLESAAFFLSRNLPLTKRQIPIASASAICDGGSSKQGDTKCSSTDAD